MKILITGMAGFIGMHLAKVLSAAGHEITGIDNLSSITYEASLKLGRLQALGFTGDPLSEPRLEHDNLTFMRLDLTDEDAITKLIAEGGFAVVVNLAALAGVRLSTREPEAYFKSNADGFFNVLNAIRLVPQGRRPRLVFASSSSVYGDCTKVPFSEDNTEIEQVSVYAATKRINEIIARTYASLYQLDAIGLRFFTVYGPWGRPDMAPFIFTRALLSGKEITLFNQGKLRRDFTYVDDIVEGVRRIVEGRGNQGKAVPFAVYNIGCGTPIELFDFVHELESAVGIKGNLILGAMQQGDVHQTYADVSKLQRDYAFRPQVSLHEGIGRFWDWYKNYYQVKI
ncbi:MAG: NAD-dependent epimerase/dehydratase family protein [Proteobacteria bacterium]|uniref:NAD-dependent epimerase/dehydratase family protein n=1 Tax=Candidatus Avisuccinivibrio stercorigallinarum TaxID=2840704 RepID=A0A9D9DCA2_9GAMM|nr:NAD-dependent epimerase/dehydratase family protein [Candidatus Avisuccinivibrio stercorigallinarum]